MLEASVRHIYVAAMFRRIRQHSRGTSTGGYPGAHGLHDNDHQSEQGVFRDRMEELRHAIPQARGFKEGHQLVCYQPDHLCQMFHGGNQESTQVRALFGDLPRHEGLQPAGYHRLQPGRSIEEYGADHAGPCPGSSPDPSQIFW